MKKKFTFIAVFCLLTFIGFSQTCPTHFTRTNGNNGATCASHIRLYFADCPLTSPTIDSVKINGVLQPETFTIFSAVCNGNSIYIDYCISDINLPPASQLTIYLTYPGACSSCGTSIICNTPEGGPQPLALSSFSLQRINGNVTLAWETQQEINTSQFEIQRAYDNASFQTIAAVAASGNSTTLKSYSFTDNTNNSQGVSFYRIKMVDVDGNFTYTSIKSVKGNGAKSGFVVFPNPSFGNAKISISDITEPTIVQLLDNSGRMVKTITLTNSNTVELNNLKAGTYIVRTIGNVTGVSSVQKLTVIK